MPSLIKLHFLHKESEDIQPPIKGTTETGLTDDQTDLSLRWADLSFCLCCHVLLFVLSCNCSFLFAEIGDIAGVAEVTIRQAYKLMYPKAFDLFPTDFQFFTPIEQLPTQ